MSGTRAYASALAAAALALTCASAAFADPRPADVPTVTAGCATGYPVGVSAQGEPIRLDALGAGLKHAWRQGGWWRAGMAAFVPARHPVTVAVVHRQRDRAALGFAGRREAYKVRFRPCDRKRTTWWPGVLKLTFVRPVTVEIHPAGRRPYREVLSG